jgi:hypothetical protein
MAGVAVRESVTVAGRVDRARVAREFVGAVLGQGHSCRDDAILLMSELFGNSVRFFLLNSCVAIAAIGEQVDLRPVLSDYLFLAADCCGTCETGQPPRSAGQLRHGCHRTRRLRKEVTHSGSSVPGETVTVAVMAGDGVVRVEVTDRSGSGLPVLRPADRNAEGGRGLQLVARLAAQWGWRRRGGRTVTWFELRYG